MPRQTTILWFVSPESVGRGERVAYPDTMSTTANRVIKNTGYLYAKMGITMFISLYTTRLILNSLGASDFGIYAKEPSSTPQI